MNISIHLKLTEKDYFQAQLLHRRLRPLITFAVLSGLSVLAIVLYIGDIKFGLFMFFPWVLGCVIFYFVWRDMLRIQTRRSFAQHKALHFPYELEFFEDKINCHAGDRGQVWMPWSDFHRWRANEKLILLYPTDRLFHFWPRRCFASDADYRELISFLEKKFGPAGKARKS